MNSNVLNFIKEIPENPSKEFVLKLAVQYGLSLKYYRSGNSRYVVEIEGTGYLAKLARGKGGLIQNEAECNPSFRQYKTLYNIPLAWNKSYSALLVIKLKTFDNEDTDEIFKNIFNLTAQELYFYVQILQSEPDEDVSYYQSKITSLGSTFVSSWLDLHVDPQSVLFNSELPGDYAKSDAYGVTPSGDIKIIDFGNIELYYNLTEVL